MKPAAISLLLNRKVRSVDAQLDKLKKKKVTPRSRPFAWDFYAKSRLIGKLYFSPLNLVLFEMCAIFSIFIFIYYFPLKFQLM